MNQIIVVDGTSPGKSKRLCSVPLNFKCPNGPANRKLSEFNLICWDYYIFSVKNGHT